MADLFIEQVNEVHCRLVCDIGLFLEISDKFTFFTEGYKFNPKFKAGFWDGKIRLANRKNGTIYKGLIPEIVNYCKEHKISVELDQNLFPEPVFKMAPEDVKAFYKQIDAPYEPKDYQENAVSIAISSGRSIIISPTASGKSYFLYGLARFYKEMGLKVLILVHRAALVDQIINDNFVEEYDKNRGSFTTHTIYAGQDKYVDADITASTWQSVVKLPEEWFTGRNPATGKPVATPEGKRWKGYDVIIADEVHAWKAMSCISIMEKCTRQKFKIGTTGTLDDIEANKMSLEGLFGPPTQVARTSELMDSGDIANLTINALILNYQAIECKYIASQDYRNEVVWIEDNQERMKFIRKMCANLEGNILIAFRHKKHGLEILNILKTENKFFVDGGVKIDTRSGHAKAMDKSDSMTGVVSLGTFAEGINIKNVNHVILACPLKSKIKLLQMIGRGLRLSDTKNSVIFWDIIDNLKHGKRKNFALIHALDRLKRYKSEGFKVNMIEYSMKGLLNGQRSQGN
jgi:superfamily II DNA or RNA helicase